MSLIVLENGCLAFGGREIMNNVSLRVGDGERIGVIGANGSGKSTLLKILCGRQHPDGGTVRTSRHCRIGYLPQDILEVAGGTLLSSVLSVVPGRANVEQQLTEAEEALAATADPEEQMDLARTLANLHEQLDHFDTYYSEPLAISILRGLGFREKDLSRPTSEFSGGWKMRAALAGLLFQRPDVLCLDEPTNHLDIPSISWLDGFLRDYKNALLLICHDREFLNRHVQRIISFEPEGVRTYSGNYDNYVNQRAQEEEILEASARNQERKIDEMERFVERFKAKATKARQAQNRVRMIEKMQEELQKPIIRPKRMKFSFPPTVRTGKDVLTVSGISKSFGSLELYRGLDLRAYAGERIAIVGVNGAGKTTLLKIIAGELAPDAGEIRLGANVELGYYAQHHTELLYPDRTVLEEVWRLAPSFGQSHVRGVCGAFLFSGDDVDKAVGVLSGGERARVLLARLLIQKSNFLLMDEPTNHLDTFAAEALAEALLTFDGTLIFVSHNRSFINHLATKIWEIDTGAVYEYPGNLEYYLERKSAQQTPEGSQLPSANNAKTMVNPASPTALSPDGRNLRDEKKEEGQRKKRDEEKEEKRRQADLRNELYRRTRQLREDITALEERIAQLEAEQKELEPRLADPAFYQSPGFMDSLRQFDDNRHKIEELYGRWEHQQEQLQQIEDEYKTRMGGNIIS